MNLAEYSIGQLSKLTGCKVPTIRYYESIALMPSPPRTEGGQRRFNNHHLERLKFICHARELGFSIDAIRELVQLDQYDNQQSGNEKCHRADEIAIEHLHRVERKIAQLEGLREELKLMIGACQSGTHRRCQVMSVLADHHLCHHAHEGALNDLS